MCNEKFLDFLLAKDTPVGHASHVSTKINGTKGCAAPQFVMTTWYTLKHVIFYHNVMTLEYQ